MSPTRKSKPVTLAIVGAGPSDPGLLTVRAAELLAAADVVAASHSRTAGVFDHVREDAEIIDFLNAQEDVGETIARFTDLLAYLVPRYQKEGKSYLSIGVGCTGGRHRSVMVANSVRDALINLGYDASVSHRDLQK